MRRTFRQHPRIKVFDPRDGFWTAPYYEYPPGNTVYLKGATEKTMLSELVHELTHWAMAGFLTDEEAIAFQEETLKWRLRRAPLGVYEAVARYLDGGHHP